MRPPTEVPGTSLERRILVNAVSALIFAVGLLLMYVLVAMVFRPDRSGNALQLAFAAGTSAALTIAGRSLFGTPVRSRDLMMMIPVLTLSGITLIGISELNLLRPFRDSPYKTLFFVPAPTLIFLSSMVAIPITSAAILLRFRGVHWPPGTADSGLMNWIVVVLLNLYLLWVAVNCESNEFTRLFGYTLRSLGVCTPPLAVGVCFVFSKLVSASPFRQVVLFIVTAPVMVSGSIILFWSAQIVCQLTRCD